MNKDTSEQKTTVEPNAARSVDVALPIIPDHQLLRRIGGGSYGEVWLARNVMNTCRAVKIVYRKTFSNDRPYEREFTGIQKFEPISRSHEGLVDVLQIGRNDTEGYFYYVMELADDAGLDANLDAGSANQKNDAQVSAATLPPPASSIQPPVSSIQKPVSSIQHPAPSIQPPVSSIHHPSSIIRSPPPDPSRYVPKTLSRVLHHRSRLPVEECLPLALSLTAALGHLHRQGLTHRDIKPSNIIFVNGVPKLADIGLVADVQESSSFVGTEGFIPPEGPGTAQADLYSLGKVLYEIVTGKDRHDFPELPTDLGEATEDKALLKLNEKILRACEADKRKRYRTAEEFHADLLLLQGGKSIKRPGVANLMNWIAARGALGLERRSPSCASAARPGQHATRGALACLAVLLGLWGAWLWNRAGKENIQPSSASPLETQSASPLLPAAVAALPAGEVLKIAYADAPPPPPAGTPRPQLQFEILAKRQAETSFSPLSDGDTLASEVDDYLVVVRPLSAGYLYLFQVDSSGKKEWLFPENSSSRFSSGANPVAAGQVIQVPSDQSDRVLFLDTTAGLEHIYAVFSATRWPELEEALAKPAPERSGPLLLARTIQEPLGLRWRGVGGTRTNTAPLSAGQALERIHHGQTYTLPVSGLAFDASGSFLAVERWFRHVNLQ